MARLFVAALLGALAIGCGGTDSGDGAEVFKTVCATCHGEDGKPPPEKVVTLHPRDFTSAQFRARVNEALVEKQVRYGSENKLMPAFNGVLREDQIKAVSAYVNARFHP